MHLGKFVELAPKRAIFVAPKHPYTQAPLSAVPVPQPRRQSPAHRLTGDVPEPGQFAQRVPLP
jgi:peptide/nickel transport system ATP-binding protein